MKKAKEYGHLASAIDKMPNKPVLHVTAKVDQYGDSMYGNDSGYHKTAAERVRKEIKHGEDAVSNWDHQKVGKQALSSLQQDLAVKKARLMEHEAYLDDDTTEGADNKGVESPDEIVSEGGQFKVKKKVSKPKAPAKSGAFNAFRMLELASAGKKSKSA